MLLKVYKLRQIEDISVNINLPKTTVESIINSYMNYIKERLSRGETIKFLNIFYIVVKSNKKVVQETLAYTSGEIANQLGISQNCVYRVLTCYQEMIENDLERGNYYNIRGIASLYLDTTYKGTTIPRIKKSSIYAQQGIYASLLNSFKKKFNKVVLE